MHSLVSAYGVRFIVIYLLIILHVLCVYTEGCCGQSSLGLQVHMWRGRCFFGWSSQRTTRQRWVCTQVGPVSFLSSAELYKSLSKYVLEKWWDSCNAAMQVSPPRCGGVSPLRGGSQRFGQSVLWPQPSHHPVWHGDRLGGRGRCCEGERICAEMGCFWQISVIITVFIKKQLN